MMAFSQSYTPIKFESTLDYHVLIEEVNKTIGISKIATDSNSLLEKLSGLLKKHPNDSHLVSIVSYAHMLRELHVNNKEKNAKEYISRDIKRLKEGDICYPILKIYEVEFFSQNKLDDIKITKSKWEELTFITPKGKVR